MIWTEQREIKLAKLWADGCSAAVIAGELGGFEHCADRGRSAVLGKIMRMKLPGPKRKMRYQGMKAGDVARPAHKPLNRSFKQASVERQDRAIEAAKVLAKKIAEPEPTMLPSARISPDLLQPTMCQWPIGIPLQPDFAYCGGQIARGSYCTNHANLAYIPTAARSPITPQRPHYRERK